jgi:cytochrome P450
VLVDNPQNYRRIPAAWRVLRPMFGRGLFLSAGEEWRRQRRAVAPAFAPRAAVHMLAPRVVAAADIFAVELRAAGAVGQPLDLVPRLQQLALGIVGEAIFSLDMARHPGELRSLILNYALRLSRPSLADYIRDDPSRRLLIGSLSGSRCARQLRSCLPENPTLSLSPRRSGVEGRRPIKRRAGQIARRPCPIYGASRPASPFLTRRLVALIKKNAPKAEA